MRKIIAALQTSVDCFIEGPNREMDWAMAEDEETWRELDALNSVDTFILGRRMYPEYEQYWLSLLDNPNKGTENEIAYSRRADKIPHIVLSKTLDKVAWKTTRIVRNVEEIRKMKQQPGRRTWRKEHERYGKFNITNYNLDGNLEGTLNFIYWKCDCCQDGFQRVRPVLHEKDLFVYEGQNVMVKGDKGNEARKVPLCNRCITLYHTKGWLVTK